MARVALESTVFAHGLPHPAGLETALTLERIVRETGADPVTIGVVAGKLVVGMSPAQIERLATSDGVRKASLRDLPVVCAQGLDAATTVASTASIAHSQNIEVVCTGGIGGVHRGSTSDISNDLTVLADTPVTLVCSGAKAILDLPATVEHLETGGVTVIGFGTNEFPGFYTRSTGLPVDIRCNTVEEVAAVVAARRSLGLSSATLVCVPVPAEVEIPADRLNPVIARSLEEAEAKGIKGAEITPFLLSQVAKITEGASLAANLALLKNNARIAAEIAVAIG